MNAKFFLIGAMLMAALPYFVCQGQPSQGYYSRPSASEDNQSLIRQAKTAISELKHMTNNHEAEIRTFESKLHNQEIILDGVKQQVEESLQAQKDLSRAQIVHIESKITQLENKIEGLDTLVKGLINDIRQIKGQANDSIQVMTQYKQKMTDLEKTLESQQQHMQNLETGLHSLVELWQAKEAAEKAMAAPDPVKTYKVQPGDNLEKIARHHKITIQALKEANGLTQDRIIVGQTLKIP